MTEPLVALISGADRSGSTLLDRLLGQSKEATSVGELSHVWERGFEKNELCSCMRPFRECPFWTKVFEEAVGGIDAVDHLNARELQRSIARYRYVPSLAAKRPWPASMQSRLETYGDLMRAVYTAITEVSGRPLVIDSSKSPRYGFVLANIPGIRLHVIHLVRDPRGVVYSNRREKVRPETGGTAFTKVIPAGQAARTWLYRNLQSELLVRANGTATRVRYESLVENPAETLAFLYDSIGLECDLSFVDGSAATLDRGHTVSGNPNRFDSGEIEIQADVEWIVEMAASDRRRATGWALPLMLRYRYGLRPHG